MATSLNLVLAKLRRATELALAYPDQTINREEAHLLLDHIEDLESEIQLTRRYEDGH